MSVPAFWTHWRYFAGAPDAGVVAVGAGVVVVDGVVVDPTPPLLPCRALSACCRSLSGRAPTGGLMVWPVLRSAIVRSKRSSPDFSPPAAFCASLGTTSDTLS